jgi:alginate O-acetyltransferase complex protein AlgI
LFQFALFKSFFPQLIAGPIVRYQQVAKDFARDLSMPSVFSQGIERFLIGLGKKVIIADNLAPVVNNIFAVPATDLSFSVAWLGVICFALQIYFDFSGYSDMAIGLGKMFGINLPENFRYPYAAISVLDFWRRWHISLSTWFRDYVYVPLGGNREGRLRTYFNLILVFALCGLWHGATWTFVVWGLYQGVFLVLEHGRVGRVIDQMPLLLRHVYLIAVVLVGWVFFRSPTLSYATAMLGAMVGSNGWSGVSNVELYVDKFVFCIIIIGLIVSMPWRSTRLPGLSAVQSLIEARPFREALVLSAKAMGLAALMFLSIAFVATQSHLAFIYFRF